MRAVLRSISSDVVDIDQWKPLDPTDFCLDLIVRIGSAESVGADDFTVRVCTPSWLASSVWTPTWGRGLLLVHSYDYEVVRKEIESYISGCRGNGWMDISEKLSRRLLWEFEDYVQ